MKFTHGKNDNTGWSAVFVGGSVSGFRCHYEECFLYGVSDFKCKIGVAGQHDFLAHVFNVFNAICSFYMFEPVSKPFKCLVFALPLVEFDLL